MLRSYEEATTVEALVSICHCNPSLSMLVQSTKAITELLFDNMTFVQVTSQTTVEVNKKKVITLLKHEQLHFARMASLQGRKSLCIDISIPYIIQEG